MGKIFQNWVTGPSIYVCAGCGAHLSRHDDIVSKQFQGRHGKAYLFHTVVNVNLGESEERSLITGVHVVCDIVCAKCNIPVGWMYHKACESCQKYKEGKYILEKARLRKITNLDLLEDEFADVNVSDDGSPRRVAFACLELETA
eukprot:TRINITY_DN66963_c5_g2_i1.p1 TRINITY_DN66963_c5_g2~~TRINITY_DN66963_c5_g2_i1.p1  ORF type:complete len:144 (+),score=4.99 TRINITY_DN66963_c5_g2_i1:80-511(+)